MYESGGHHLAHKNAPGPGASPPAEGENGQVAGEVMALDTRAVARGPPSTPCLAPRVTSVMPVPGPCPGERAAGQQGTLNPELAAPLPGSRHTPRSPHPGTAAAASFWPPLLPAQSAGLCTAPTAFSNPSGKFSRLPGWEAFARAGPLVWNFTAPPQHPGGALLLWGPSSPVTIPFWRPCLPGWGEG